ncbi:MAG TPA: hypothetical protein VLF62_02955 [Candidatus Saccharimonadales bacterium]|nr:hypothetical protein [Candidatus Saccharimonadales bacterium]
MANQLPGFEIGTINDITVVAGVVAKITREPLPTGDTAEALAAQLERYHTLVAAGPLAVADLVSVNVLQRADGYHVQHSVELVEGRALSQLPEDERCVALGALVHTVEDMPASPHGDRTLLTPLDAKPRNFHMRGEKPVLIDVCPPFTWGDDGFVTTAIVPNMAPAWRAQTTGTVGYRSGVLSELLMGAMPDIAPGESPLAHARRVIATAPDWYEPFVPANMPQSSRDDLTARIGLGLSLRLIRAQRAGNTSRP